METTISEGLGTMGGRLLSLATFCAALGSGLVGGVFFAFSTFVMPALGRLGSARGIAAMQSINVAAINAWLLGALMGTAALCFALAVTSLVTWSQAGAQVRFAGSVLYCIGAVVVTIACNVPRNVALAALDPGSPEAAEQWTRYLASWTSWNHVRGAAAFVAAALLILALIRSSAAGALAYRPG